MFLSLSQYWEEQRVKIAEAFTHFCIHKTEYRMYARLEAGGKHPAVRQYRLAAYDYIRNEPRCEIIVKAVRDGGNLVDAAREIAKFVVGHWCSKNSMCEALSQMEELKWKSEKDVFERFSPMKTTWSDLNTGTDLEELGE
jgi:hypothetical protein